MFLGSAFLVKGTNGGSFLLSASTAKLLIGARRLHAHTFRALRFDPGASGHINVYGRLVRVADLGQKKLFFTPELNREVMKIVRALSLPSAGNSWNTVELLQRHSPFRCMNRIVEPLLALKIETGIPWFLAVTALTSEPLYVLQNFFFHTGRETFLLWAHKMHSDPRSFPEAVLLVFTSSEHALFQH